MKKRTSLERCKTWALFCLIGCASSMPSFGAQGNSIVNAEKRRIDESVNAQNKVDWVEKSRKQIESEYIAEMKKVKALSVYSAQLKKQIDYQENELLEIEDSIKQVVDMERDITPLMLRMLETIQGIANEGIPSESDELQQKLNKVTELMNSSNVTVAEKYRHVTSLYQDEIRRSNTMKAYRDNVSIDGVRTEVDMLRVGRLTLVYLTLDGKKGGVWNGETKKFDNLPSDAIYEVSKSIKVAREQLAPNLITVPVYGSSSPSSLAGKK